jgi:UDP-glucose 4-epimerase
MKVLITGGAGFIGSNIADLLIENGYEVVIVDNLSTGKHEFINKKAVFYNKDITDDDLHEVFEKEKPDYVIHQAAQIDIQKSIKEPVFDAKVNILGTVNLLECSKSYKVKKIIYASSAAVYGDPEYLAIDEKHKVDPISYYGISKHTPEHYFEVYRQLYGLKYTILRYANVYGIRQDPKGVKDVAKANLLALEKGDNEIVNISTNKPTSINELIDLMNKIMGTSLKPIYAEPRKGDIVHSYLDNKKALDVLGWKPSLEEGLRETIEYYRVKYAEDEVAISRGE